MRIRDGKEPTYPAVGKDMIQVPEDICMPTEDIQDLVEYVYGQSGSQTIVVQALPHAARRSYSQE